ncbi:MAG TPA: alpha-amylase family glycosyl hydrolase [Myxococcota bacterium]
MLLPALFAALVAATPPPVDERSVVALIMVDRFSDGAVNAADVVVGHPRRFQGGDLAGVRARLPYLKALGVSHLWLTPLHDQIDHLVGEGDTATAGYHGYWPERFRAVDPHFGTIEELRTLVDEAAANDMGVIIDVVVNHFGYGAKQTRSLVRPSCGDDDETRCLFGLPDLQTELPRVRSVVVDNTRWWLRQAPFVGVRLDAFKHIDRQTALAITRMAHRQRAGTMVIAERWGAEPGSADVVADVKAGAADAAFDFGLMGLARDFVVGRLRPKALAHHLEQRAQALSSGPPMLTFLDNHDVETWAHAAGEHAPLGAALLLGTPGIPAITWGSEVGRVGGAVDPDNRTMIDWARVDDPLPKATRAWWSSLIALRRSSAALQRGAFTILAADDAAGAIAFARTDGSERVVVVIAGATPFEHAVVLGATEAVVDGSRWPAAPLPAVETIGDARRFVARVPAHGAVVVRLRTPLR